MGGGSSDSANTTGVVDATCNKWGAASGPSSPHMLMNGLMHDNMKTDDPLTDPETGAAADGTGSAVSEGPEAGVSNVHFDPWVPPPSACTQSDDIPEDNDPTRA